MPNNQNNSFYIAVEAENLCLPLGGSQEAIFMPLVEPEKKTIIARKMEELLEKIEQNDEYSNKDKILYRLVFAANLTLYFYEKQEADKQILYWEKMQQHYDSWLEQNDDAGVDLVTAEWSAVVARVYQTIKHYAAAIEHYELAISFAKADANEEDKLIQDEKGIFILQKYCIGLAETYLAYGNMAHKETSQYPFVFVEDKYLETIKAVQQGLQLIHALTPYTTKLYYYQAQATYLLAVLYYQNKHPDAACYLFLQAMLADSQALSLTTNNKEKLTQHLLTCYKAFSSIVAKLPSNKFDNYSLCRLATIIKRLPTGLTLLKELEIQAQKLESPLKNHKQLQAYLQITSQTVSVTSTEPDICQLLNNNLNIT